MKRYDYSDKNFDSLNGARHVAFCLAVDLSIDVGGAPEVGEFLPCRSVHAISIRRALGSH